MSSFFSFFDSSIRAENTADEILQHIQYLLNTRQGSVSHIPEYGLPDYGKRSDYYSASQFYIRVIKEQIYRFEPRVESIIIKEMDNDEDCILRLTFNADIYPDSHIKFQSRLLTNGKLLITKME